jgi:heptosyltransferase-2
MHVVIVRFSSLGDIILQTPVLSWLKINYPEVEISFVTSKEFSSLVEDHPLIDNVFYIKRDRGLKDIQNIRDLSQQISSFKKIDFIIDLHGTLRAKLLRLFLFNTPKLIVDKRSLSRWLLVKLKLDFLGRQSSHHHRLLEDFAFIFNKEYSCDDLVHALSDISDYDLKGVTTNPLSFKRSPKKLSEKYIVISPIASFESKRWPIAKVQELINTFLNDSKYTDYTVGIIAGPNDTYCTELEGSERLVNLQGKTNLAESMEYISQAELCFTNDTGSLHIAESFGIPVLALFGPTSESFGFRPHLEESESLSLDLWCRPCSNTGSKKCFRKEQYCMTDLSTEKVYSRIDHILSNEERHV